MSALFCRPHVPGAARGVFFGAALTFSSVVAHAQPLDPAFNPGVNAEVFALAVQLDGKILLGGNFTTVGNTARSRFARLNADGSLDSAFNPAPNTGVRAIRVQPDGRILVGGSFTNIGGAGHVRLARLNADGSVDTTFTAGTDNTIFDLALQPDGKILLAGNFTEVSGVARVGLARLNRDGSLDSAFNAAISGTNTPASFFVESVVVQADGKILFGGNFATVAGQSRNGAARLNADGSLDAGFNPNANSDVQDFAVQPDGKFFMVGSFSRLGTQTRNHIARFNADGSLDPAFTIGTDSGIQHVAVQTDGKVVIAGSFGAVGSTVRSRLARFNADGSLDLSFIPDVSGGLGLSTPAIYAMVLPAPGQIIIGGAFSAVSGAPRSGLARFGSPLPTITMQPASVLAATGANLTLAVVATGDALRIQWQRNGTAVVGANGSTLALSNVQPTVAGSYTATVTNSFGATTTASAVVTIGLPQAPTYTFSTLTGSAGISGNADGSGANARFANPSGLALDPSGNIYVIDSNGLRRITPTGTVATVAPSAGQFVSIDGAGDVYTVASSLIRKYTAGVGTTLAGSILRGNRDGPGSTAQFSPDLRGIAADRSGNLYVTDTGNLSIRKITPAGVVSTLAAFDPRGDVGAPAGIVVDAAGTVFLPTICTAESAGLIPTGLSARWFALCCLPVSKANGSRVSLWTAREVSTSPMYSTT
ncbi:MAG: hypothetical protein EXS37_00970 [Opitutus sp.]|nr:hypothetical protein [Opitutus sp.]